VQVLLAVTPTMPASTLAERVNWPGSPSLFRAKVAETRPEYKVPDPADQLVHLPGSRIQGVLWFPHEDLPLGDPQVYTPPVLVMTPAFSGCIQARILPSSTTPDLLGGTWAILQGAGSVTARSTWGNGGSVDRGKLTEPADAFAGIIGAWIKLVKAREPEFKGMVQQMNQFFPSRFISGRTFASPEDFNQQLVLWLPIGNNRMPRSRRGQPGDLIAVIRAAMRSLPPGAPRVMSRNSIRPPRDCYVPSFSNELFRGSVKDQPGRRDCGEFGGCDGGLDG
jgi:hypothetical protein